MTRKISQADVAVVGAGLVGQATALALAARRDARGLKVVLIDGREPALAAGPEDDPRASAITATSRAMLDALGIWPQLREHAQPMREIKVTDAKLGAKARPALLYFGEELAGGGASAHMVENHHMLSALSQAVTAHPGISVLTGSQVAGITRDGPAARVRLADDCTIAAGLVVAADGRNSFIRTACGIDTVGWSYPQHGIVTTVSHEAEHNGVAEEHFLPAGPFAILPLRGNRSSLVWTEDSAAAKKLVAGSDAKFAAQLEARFGSHLGAVRPVGPRASFPLSMHLAKAYVANRVALVGDAAHIVHPIAGLGFNLGLRDAAALSDTIVSSLRLGQDIGSTAVLRGYETARRFDNVLVALSMDGLNRLFSNDNPVIRAVRDAGLTLVDSASPLKRFFMAQAAGRTADLPSLMRADAVRP